MNKQEFINACHAAQHDAGSQINFNKQVTKAEEVCEHGQLNDPVAAFLGSLLYRYGNNIPEIRESLGFWFSEIERIHGELYKE
jgi:hypothetical protein